MLLRLRIGGLRQVFGSESTSYLLATQHRINYDGEERFQLEFYHLFIFMSMLDLISGDETCQLYLTGFI